MTTYSDPSVTYDTDQLLYNGADVPRLLAVIGGVRHDEAMIPGSLRVTHLVEERTAGRFRIEDGDASLRFTQGQPVKVRVKGKRAFEGVIADPTQHSPSPFGLIHDLDCTDWHYLTDRRVIARAFTNTTAGQVVRDIVSDVLADDGITQGTISDGPVVDEVVFNYVTATQALTRLAEEANFTWQVDFLKRLHFHAREATPAPFQLNGVTEYAKNLKVSPRNPDYRNRQYIRGGRAETDPQTERYHGDGEQRTFVVGFPIAREPTIEVNGAPQVVGVKGISDDDETVQWRWARGSTELTQDEDETRLETGDLLEVTYTGMFDLVMIATDSAEVEGRKTTEGFGTGLVDHVLTDAELTTVAGAANRAASLLARFARIGRKLTFSTEQGGLEPGQLLTVTIDEHGIEDDEFLISQVVATDQPRTTLRYDVTAVEGPVEGSWARFFARLAETVDPLQFRENIGEEETVIILESIVEQTGWSEDIVTAVFACMVTSSTTDTYDDPTIGYADVAVDYGGRQAWVIIPATADTYGDATIDYDDPAVEYGGRVAGRLVAC